jgi:RNA polymerase sigma-70 factor (ECF subfamily)
MPACGLTEQDLLQMNRRDSDFARVYDEHVERVYGFLAYRAPDRHTAEDLTQTTFERALRAWSRFDPARGSEIAWLLTIARNVYIDDRRRDRSARIEPIEERIAPSVPGPEERYAGRPEILSALGALSDRDQEVVALRFGGDLTGPEIASLLDLRLANVQQILSRSVRKLRQLLEVETRS